VHAVDLAYLKRVVTLPMIFARYDVSLKIRGNVGVGCCPIHGGSNPKQFSANLATGAWQCFAPHCRASGGVIDFVAHKESVTLPAAAELIADYFALYPAASQPKPHARRMPMTNNRPSHRAYSVEERPGSDPDGERQSFFTRIGVCFPHGDGKGLNIILSALPLGNRIVLREYTPDEEEPPQSKPAKKKS
jgi:hypothetical protein